MITQYVCHCLLQIDDLPVRMALFTTNLVLSQYVCHCLLQI